MESGNQIKQNKKKTGIIIAIVAVILVILIIAGIIGTSIILIGHNNSASNPDNAIEENKVELTKWMESYISEIKKKASELNGEGKVYIQLIKSTENAVPIMLLKYDEEENGNKTQTICAVLSDDEGKIETPIVYSYVKEIKAFYNKEASDYDKEYYKYDLFIVSEDDKQYTYSNVVDELYKSKNNNSTTSNESNKTQFVFSKTDETLKKEKEKEFSNVYIEVEKDEEINKWVEFDKNSNQDELVKVFKEEVDKNKNIQEILTKEENEKIAKQGVEEKKAQAEEKKKKQEEANSKLKFTKYTLQYGIYKSTNPSIETITIQLNADKTCSYSGKHPDGREANVNSTGTFEVEFNGDDGYGNKVDWITLKLKDGTKAPFIVNRDNNFGSQWLGFEYAGSSNSSTNEEKLNTSNSTVNTQSNNKKTENNATSNNTVTAKNTVSNNTTTKNTVSNNTISKTTTNKNTSKVSDKPTMKNAISQEEALKLAQKKWGKNEGGNQMGYMYNSWIQDEKGMQYYVFQLKWLVDNSHWSFLQTVCVSADGKTYKEIYTPNYYENGEVVKKFDGEGKF